MPKCQPQIYTAGRLSTKVKFHLFRITKMSVINFALQLHKMISAIVLGPMRDA